MNIEELEKLKEEFNTEYENMVNNSTDETDKGALNDLKKEIDKIDSLINIYSINDLDIRVMKLERLYMQIIYSKSEEEYNKLDIDKKSDMFNNSFPDTWTYMYSQAEKEDLLIDSIVNNKLIKPKKEKILDKIKRKLGL